MTPVFIHVAIEVTEKESIMKNMNSPAKKIVVATGATLSAGTALGGVTRSAQAATKPDAEELQ